ncbi:transcriptional regulator family: HMG [Penicillium alfredii]|uniref:Transcriptional regulator family: HMG n=1 Tax=Penicillium alfredii TaxID=1506179 RepID=A0A9W9GAZ0_9EURO|nr:transcriptional regulator family: HMG [Penicillium alfredii]KAJ5114665.1 transcriptional regulator family: HMG [Penicillium alfredii]
METAVTISPPPSPTEIMLYRYLTSITAFEAANILGSCPENTRLADYAAKVVAELPASFFEQPIPVPEGPHFVFENNKFFLDLGSGEEVIPPVLESSGPVNGHPAMGKVVPTRRVPDRPGRRLRPLNSFMVFRTYCSPVFPGIPQKTKSAAISTMWDSDTIKDKWAVLARAYTVIRDEYEIANPSLPEFVELTSVLFGLPTPKDYLRYSGWEIAETGAGFDLIQTGENCVHEYLSVDEPLSVEDVLSYCELVDYAVPKDDSTSQQNFQNESVLAIGAHTWVFNDEGERKVSDNEFEVEEMYSELDPVIDFDIEPIYDPDQVLQLDSDVPMQNLDALNAYLTYDFSTAVDDL